MVGWCNRGSSIEAAEKTYSQADAGKPNAIFWSFEENDDDDEWWPPHGGKHARYLTQPRRLPVFVQ